MKPTRPFRSAPPRRAPHRVLALAFALLALGCDGSIGMRDGRLRDGLGRERVVRGVNARVEGIFDVTFDDGRRPVETVPPFGEADCRLLAEELGMNLLRLPVNWSGVEPQRGQYDEAYIARVVALVDACHRAGVLTVVDFHQDAWSKHIGQDGAPLWAIVPPPTQLLEGPITDLDARRGSAQVLAAFGSFFRNEQGLQDAFADMAVHVARALDGHPGVLGMELMNEPIVLPGQVPGGLSGIITAVDDFHRKVGAAVQAAVPTMTILVEPHSIRNNSDAIPVVPGFPLDDVVYAPHVYTGVFSPLPPTLASLRLSTTSARDEARQIEAPLFVGEWGTDPRSATGRQYMLDAMQAFDESLASWAFWVYEEIPPAVWGLWDTAADFSTRSLRAEAADVLARPFPQLVDGDLRSIAWDPATRTLRVGFTASGRRLGHRIAWPRRTWPAGARARCDGAVVGAHHEPGGIWVLCDGAELVLAPR